MLISFIQSAVNGGDMTDAIISILLSLPVIIIALSCHEASHGLVAHWMGDHTAYNLGRITLNPLKHLDPLGFFMMLIFGYGWAKPVPINTRNFKKPKLGMALTGLAGPLSNLLLGILGTVLSAAAMVGLHIADLYEVNDTVFNIIQMTYLFFYLFGIYNFVLMAFNLIPIPPFDGSRFMLAFLPANAYFKIMKYERIIMFAILIIMIILPISPFSWIANTIYNLIFTPSLALFVRLASIFI